MTHRLLTAAALLLFAAVAGPIAFGPCGPVGDPGALPPPERLVDIGEGQRVHVVERGSGPTLVLIHGQPSMAFEWETLTERLARDHRVVAYDRIGWGHSTRRPEGARFTLDANARELLALLDVLAIERAVLLGWSYGGGMAQALAGLAPERVARVVLIGSVGPAEAGQDPFLFRLLDSALADWIFAWLRAVPPAARALAQLTARDAFGDEAAVPGGWLERTLTHMTLPGTLETLLRENRESDSRRLRPEAVHVPVLVIHGEEDRLVAHARGVDLHRRLPRSQLLSVPGGSHMLPVTHPELLATSIRAFLAEPGA